MVVNSLSAGGACRSQHVAAALSLFTVSASAPGDVDRSTLMQHDQAKDCGCQPADAVLQQARLLSATISSGLLKKRQDFRE